MSKKTVNISQQLLLSIFIGFCLSFIIVIVGHLFHSNWYAIPQTSNSVPATSLGTTSLPWTTPVASCSYECLFGSSHSANCSGHNISNFSQTTVSLDDMISASFEHINLMLTMGFIISAIIYILHRVNFKIIKE